MVGQKRTSTPLGIPKLAPLETQTKQSLTGEVRIWDKKRKFPGGVTLVELILVVLFLGIFAVIAVPRLQFATLHGKQADTVAKKIVTDLRRTRRLAISDAANNTNGFQLKMIGTSPSPVPVPIPMLPLLAATVPVPLGYTGYEIINLNTGTTIDSHTIDSGIRCTGGRYFSFGPLGNLKAGSDTQLTVAAGGKSFTITIISATGMVKCVEN